MKDHSLRSLALSSHFNALIIVLIIQSVFNFFLISFVLISSYLRTLYTIVSPQFSSFAQILYVLFSSTIIPVIIAIYILEIIACFQLQRSACKVGPYRKNGAVLLKTYLYIMGIGSASAVFPIVISIFSSLQEGFDLNFILNSVLTVFLIPVYFLAIKAVDSYCANMQGDFSFRKIPKALPAFLIVASVLYFIMLIGSLYSLVQIFATSENLLLMENAMDIITHLLRVFVLIFDLIIHVLSFLLTKKAISIQRDLAGIIIGQTANSNIS